MKINILDYNCGNIWSVKNAFSFLGFETNIIKTADQVLDSDCLILPGDGSFKIIKDIKNNNLIDSLNHMAKIKKIPVLGICLGMQLFGSTSEETESEFKVKKKIPHIGFNSLKIIKDDELFYNIDENSKFYFVHSYYFQNKHKEDIIAETQYEIFFPSVIKKDNIVGTQFHPEKSQNHGIQFLYNFLNYFDLI